MEKKFVVLTNREFYYAKQKGDVGAHTRYTMKEAIQQVRIQRRDCFVVNENLVKVKS